MELSALKKHWLDLVRVQVRVWLKGFACCGGEAVYPGLKRLLGPGAFGSR